jgi:hypothetical protein
MLRQTHHSREPEYGRDPENVYETIKPTVDELIESLSQLNRTSAESLKTDVEIALTFSTIALRTENIPKRQRNGRNARKGYDTILRLVGRVRLTSEDEQFLSEKLARLKLELQRLGETF